MKLIGFAIKSAFLTGAFLSGTVLGICINKYKLTEKLKKMQYKKNPGASIK
tara:strand:+ start:2019 stop:2171 length:153 start_codon:yes stop_codon:yes gene_type:complete